MAELQRRGTGSASSDHPGGHGCSWSPLTRGGPGRPRGATGGSGRGERAPKGYRMHSAEFPTTMSCRSQASTTARCRLRGRRHLREPRLSPGPSQPLRRDATGSRSSRGAATATARATRGAGGARPGATHQTICRGGDRMLQLNSQIFSCGGTERELGQGDVAQGQAAPHGHRGHVPGTSGTAPAVARALGVLHPERVPWEQPALSQLWGQPGTRLTQPRGEHGV